METGRNMPVNELTQGPEQESELYASIELCMSLAQEILASIDKALSRAQSGGCQNLSVGPPDSPRSPRSPRSGITRLPLKAKHRGVSYKKRKLGAGSEAEGPLDDGYTWRKYGQKVVLGEKHPRSYYRCTDSMFTHGCQAKKQVQRSDDNPAIFNVTYRGTHTCPQKPSPPAATASSCLSSPRPSTPYNSMKRSITSATLSSVTSELNCFSSSPGRENPSLQASESFAAMVSALASGSNSSVFDLDLNFPEQSSAWDPEVPY